MSDDARLRKIIDELLDSRRTPEEVCASCPELLPRVRRRWGQIRRLQAELDSLFPLSSECVASPPASQLADGGLPDIPGYLVESVLGRGGVSIVYRASHLRLRRPVALKMLLTAAAADPRERERFQREAEAVASLRHLNIVQIYEVADANGQPYFTMEFVEKGSLAEKIRGVPQPARQSATLVATLSEAIQRLTRAASCIATSSPATSSSRRTARRRSPTSASPGGSTVTRS